MALTQELLSAPTAAFFSHSKFSWLSTFSKRGFEFQATRYYIFPAHFNFSCHPQNFKEILEDNEFPYFHEPQEYMKIIN